MRGEGEELGEGVGWVGWVRRGTGVSEREKGGLCCVRRGEDSTMFSLPVILLAATHRT